MHHSLLPSWRQHVLPVLLLNSVIALGLTLFGPYSLVTNLVYSQAIGLSISSLIWLGLALWIADWSCHGRRMVAIVPACVVLGSLLGIGMADVALGQSSLADWATRPRKFWGTLALSFLASAVSTYYFVSRGQLQAVRQAAEVAQRQAAQARLKLLETQLEPHMLFNTLANLRALIALEPQRAQTMLDHLIAYLRATLSASRASQHTVAQEFDRLDDYLSLMAVRMGPRLRFSFDLPAELADHSMPALLLQPLVENAIRHGLEPQVQGGHIQVQARRSGDGLRIDITDTGVGLAPLSPSPSAGAAGFGLQQVRERLTTLYGASATLEIVAVDAGGTRVSVQFPLKS